MRLELNNYGKAYRATRRMKIPLPPLETYSDLLVVFFVKVFSVQIGKTAQWITTNVKQRSSVIKNRGQGERAGRRGTEGVRDFE